MRLRVLLAVVAIGLCGDRSALAQSRGRGPLRLPAAAVAEARARGTTRVIIGLDVAFTPEALLGPPGALAQRSSIAAAQAAVLGRIARANTRARRFAYIPFIAVEVDEAELQMLAASPEVTDVEIDALAAPTLAQSTVLVGATRAWAAGYTGAGWTVAILDTGVDSTHPFLAGKVVAEACYSSTLAGRSASVCPGGVESSTAAGSGMPCSMAECDHGTHVAGIAAGRGAAFSGVARDASLIALQTFSSFGTTPDCGSHPVPCALSFTSDQILALERVYSLRGTYNIAAVNMSLGGGLFSTPCDSDSTKAIIDQLRAAGIATVVASGNNGSTTSLSAPACVSTAISVGSTTDGTSGAADQVSSFTNSNQYLSLLAPGQTITSSVPGGGFANFNGTSMAAPHVAGAWALMKSRRPTATVTEILEALAYTGTGILDPGNGLTKPRINVDIALQALAPPCSYSVSPTQLAAAPQAGAVSIAVTTGPGCSWSATSLSPFLTVSNWQPGVGPGTVVVSYAANPGAAARSGAVAIAGSTVTISQRGTPTRADVNGDGHADILWQNVADGSLATWYLDAWNVIGQYSLSINRVPDTNWRVVGSGDLNGDGTVDLVWQHLTEGWLAVWYLSGLQVVSTQFLSINRVTDTNWKIAAVGDVDGDGHADLIWQHQTDGWLAVWTMNGTQVTGTRFLSIEKMPEPKWRIVAAGDTNGDGKADILWQHQTEGWLAVWYLDGSSVVGTTLLSVDRMPDPNWHIRGAGDVDADGKADIIWQNDANGGLGLWLLDGSTVVGQRNLSIDHVPDLNWKVAGPG